MSRLAASSIEAYKVEKAFQKAHIPMPKNETDCSMEDAKILKNRVEAFAEMVKDGK